MFDLLFNTLLAVCARLVPNVLCFVWSRCCLEDPENIRTEKIGRQIYIDFFFFWKLLPYVVLFCFVSLLFQKILTVFEQKIVAAIFACFFFLETASICCCFVVVSFQDPSKHLKAWEELRSCHGVLVPGGFGSRGLEGKIQAIEYARLVFRQRCVYASVLLYCMLDGFDEELALFLRTLLYVKRVWLVTHVPSLLLLRLKGSRCVQRYI